MGTKGVCLVAALVLGLPGLSVAQTVASHDAANVRYCKKLAEKYSREHNLYEGVTADKAVAISRCDMDAAASITTLEAAMKDARIALPSKETAAGSQQ